MKKTVAQLWKDIFNDYHILEEIKQKGTFKITADQIRNYKEPRLMAKFDFSKQLPNIFKENHFRKNIPNMAEKKVNRRASTIRGWVEWIIGAQV